jgi:murein L,D-transpeptidase YafK
MSLRLALTVSLLAAVAPLASGSATAPCSSPEPQVIVATKDHKLWLCDGGRPVTSYRISLGRGGTDKRVQGDNKTPLGTYPLGAPRPSSRFGTFIPVAYPTPEQQRQGLTGSDVGIHGPDRRFRWAGRMNAWFDWTAGCVALATDEEVQAVAAWVQKRKPNVTIR